MPVETIKCSGCGSAEVTKFKAGTYVCGYCESVFKHVSPGAAFGGCQIDDCGVPAVGRCSSCNLRFCRTHKAEIALCAQCRVQEQETARLTRETTEREDARKRDVTIAMLQGARDPREIARLITETPQIWREHYARKELIEVWRTLVTRHGLRAPSHDVVNVTLHEANPFHQKRLAYSEASREHAWSAPAAATLTTGGYHSDGGSPVAHHRIDALITASGETHTPYAPLRDLSIWQAVEDDKTIGRGEALVVAVPHGASIRTRKHRDWYGAEYRVRREFVDCTILSCGRGPSRGLREHVMCAIADAIVAALRAQDGSG